MGYFKYSRKNQININNNDRASLVVAYPLPIGMVAGESSREDDPSILMKEYMKICV